MNKKLTCLAITLFLAIPYFGYCNIIQRYFQKVPISDQLPSNSVTRLYHDKLGFMWFGTKDGLCRYDGYSLKIFRSNWNTPARLTNNVIECITEDDSNIWVGTDEGVNVVNKKTYQIAPLSIEDLKTEQINSILIDRDKNVWIGTSRKGVYKISEDGKKVANYRNIKSNNHSIGGNCVIHLFQDRQGRIWVSSWEKGLSLYQPKTDNFYRFPPIGSRNNPFRVFQDRDNQIWICTWGDGIFTLDTSKLRGNPFVPFKFESNGKVQPIDQVIYSITQDPKFGYIWAISFNGLYLFEKKDRYTCKIHDTGNLFEDAANKIFHDIVVDRRGNLWIGSEGEGVYRLDFNQPGIRNFSLPEVKKALGSTPNITRLCESADGKLFTVVNRAGLYILDPKTGNTSQYINPNILANKSIFAISRIKSLHQIWVCFQGQNNINVINDDSRQGRASQILTVDKNAGQISSANILEDTYKIAWIGMSNGVYFKPLNGTFKKLPQKLSNASIIKEDIYSNVWIVCEQGIFRYLRQHHKIEKVSFDEYDGNIALNFNDIQSVCCKRNGEVCFGTKEGSLFVYNDKQKTIKDVSKEYGIVEDAILDIVEDNYGMLWISTTKRIVRYNPNTHAASYFTAADGLTVNSFSQYASVKLASGQILFGGNKGISAFSPQSYSLSAKPKRQQIAITDILIQNQSIFDLMDDKHFNPEKNRITIRSSENNFGLEFSSLDYSTSSKIQYAYMLEGIDKNWTYVGNNRRSVNYANLPSGRYTFKVKASDENGVWTKQEASLNIVIKPPFYRSWWAYIIYLGIVIASIISVSKTVANRIRLKNELRISTIEKEKTEELAQLKLRYFTNISHELLTPLTIISLLIENLQKRHAEDSKQLGMMMSNVSRLRRLIQQILAFKKTESGSMKLNIQKTDIISFVNNICQSNFQPLIQEKEINFVLDVDQECYIAYFDMDKVDKVLYNLLSNAFKHTPKGGEIRVKIRFVPRYGSTIMVLSVSDTGEGIAEVDLPNVFKRFYISKTSDQSQSHGIGLSLTQDLVQIHKGHIRVNSTPGEGAVFTFEIPVSRDAYSDEEMDEEGLGEYPAEEELAAEQGTEEERKPNDASKKDFTILIAEDNPEINKMVADYFTEHYNVLSAENGVKALSLIRENDIDLLISDVMMPELDGLSLCQMIKNDVSISHIGVLMLTAKNSTEDRIDCYNAGADGYIAKPFEMRMLDARVKNLISKRVKNSQNFQSNMEVNISDMGYSSIDEEFLKQAVAKVENKLADITFDFEGFASDMGTSKSTLHRKLKSLTGMSPGEFIRNIRLKHAAKLLLSNAGNVSEIAYSVGFNDSKYFSRSFKAEFGLTPTEYRDKHEEISKENGDK
jgi:signal transduction histidine kinase/ligand-binding sensor domain-containing protein/DNA-binding response OmpR family regulator